MRWNILTLVSVLLTTTACGNGTPSSNDPPPPAPEGINYAVFTSADGFMTSDVRDVDNEFVRFDIDTDAMIWLADRLAFDGFPVEGNFLGQGRPYEVRFGTVNGEPRAYFTEVGPGTLCDLQVNDGFLTIQPTNVLPPLN